MRKCTNNWWFIIFPCSLQVSSYNNVFFFLNICNSIDNNFAFFHLNSVTNISPHCYVGKTFTFKGCIFVEVFKSPNSAAKLLHFLFQAGRGRPGSKWSCPALRSGSFSLFPFFSSPASFTPEVLVRHWLPAWLSTLWLRGGLLSTPGVAEPPHLFCVRHEAAGRSRCHSSGTRAAPADPRRPGLAGEAGIYQCPARGDRTRDCPQDLASLQGQGGSNTPSLPGTSLLTALNTSIVPLWWKAHRTFTIICYSWAASRCPGRLDVPPIYG